MRACYAALRMQESVKRYAEDVRRIARACPSRSASGSTPARSWCAPSAATCTWTTRPSGQTTHLAARMEQLADAGHASCSRPPRCAGRGLRAGQAAGARARQGPGRAGGGVRAGRRGRRALAACRPPRPAGSRASSGATAELDAAPPGPGAGRRRPRPGGGAGRRARAWASRGSSGSSPTPTAPRAGSCSRAARCPTARPPPTCRSSTCSRRYFQIEERDDARTIREKVTGKLLDARPRRSSRSLPALLALLDVAGGRSALAAARPAAAPPAHARRRSSACCCARARCSRCCCVFEDLHWIDTETQALLDSLVESLPTARLLLLVNYRPEYQHGWGSKTYYTQLRARPAAGRERGRAARRAARRRSRAGSRSSGC